MKVFFDTNVVLDIFLQRQPFYEHSVRLWAMAERRDIEGMISAISATNLYYVVRRNLSRDEAMEMLQATRSCVSFATCNAAVLNQAIDSGFSDFEDAVQYFSAIVAGADVIVTRNEQHFTPAEISVLSPTAFLATQNGAS